MCECTHEIEIPGHWDEDEDLYPVWVPESPESTCVDIDLHRYQCTACRKVMYYSERARKYYEDGEGELP